MVERGKASGPGDVAYGSVLRVEKLAQPAAGASAIFTVPGNMYWHVKSVMWRLTTSAAVANRLSMIACDDQTDIFMRITTDQLQAASVVTNMAAAATGAAYQNGSSARPMISLPADLILPPGHRLRIDVDSMDAADQLSNCIAWIEEFPSLSEYGYQKARLEQLAHREHMDRLVLSDLERE